MKGRCVVDNGGREVAALVTTGLVIGVGERENWTSPNAFTRE